MAQRILRPLSYGDLFDETFELYKSKFLVLAGIAGVVYLPLYVIAYGLGGPIGQGLAAVLSLPLTYLVMAATTYAVSQLYLGNETTIADSYKSIRPRAVPFFGTMMLAGIFIFGGMLACIVPGVMLAFRYSFISQVFIIEGLSSTPARHRSAQLAEGQYGRIFVVGLLASLLVWIGSAIITIPAQMIALAFGRTAYGFSTPGYFVMGVSQGLAQALITPIEVIALVLLYFDVRVRKEGFDVELLASSLASSAEICELPQGPASNG